MESNKIHIDTHFYSKHKLNILMVETPNGLLWWIGSRWGTSEIFEKCQFSNCVLHRNMTLFDEVDAVVFRFGVNKNSFKRKKLGQIWIFYEHESPKSFTNYKTSDKRSISRIIESYNNKINWTMTYRRDSDIIMPYGSFKHHHSAMKDMTYTENVIQHKTKMAASFQSNCVPDRIDFTRELLKRGLKLDVYGRCGMYICRNFPRTCHVKQCGYKNHYKIAVNLTNEVVPCLKSLDTDYKFYLSFENSLCIDYVSEKSLDFIMRHNVVPVIRDGAITSLYHPPHSYIDVNQFPVQGNLVSYLRYVDKNQTAYAQYFKWRSNYQTATMGSQKAFCDLCQRLNNQELYKRQYNNISNWVYQYGNSSACRN